MMEFINFKIRIDYRPKPNASTLIFGRRPIPRRSRSKLTRPLNALRSRPRPRPLRRP